MSRKALVYSLWALETLHLVLVTQDLYRIFIEGFGIYAVANDLHLLPLTIGIMGGLIGFICHVTLAYRVLQISQSRAIAGLIALLSMSSSTFAIVFGSKMFQAKTLINAVGQPQTSSLYLACGLWNGFGAACDVLIAATTIFFLSKLPSGFRKTDMLITRIIRMTIETGLITATASTASVVLYVGFRDRVADVGIFFVLPAISLAKLYSITIMATFNNRPNAVGGPPAIPDTQNTFDASHGKNHRPPIHDILIGKTVVQQVWPEDSVAMTHIEVLLPTSKSFKTDLDCSNIKAFDIDDMFVERDV
ncbi:hypothetical protein HYPSUDRAFT_217979 [Hypholoma sublateritium FD-334 SS-4]|uniref:DUF6534 domain-containing protein n=1 Tax=Hypholoma sublateritium (strain FD-334 SS-4) TaxID=945553 RepID=A0A0D2M6F6_HYPSF|nr:hypothetical protein HYPSUDRAFT_217979 [Hypholoma sublateritium FD-334 SS-4]